MTACIPDEPTYCFAPVTDTDGEPPQIRILVEGLTASPDAGSVPSRFGPARATASDPAASGRR